MLDQQAQPVDHASVAEAQVIMVEYTNYRDETAIRRIIPKRLLFQATKWHPRPQWIMEAYDLDRKADRSFALQDVVSWHAP